jgi:type IV pilus assembly protein PilA
MPATASFAIDTQASTYVSSVAYAFTNASVGVITATSKGLPTAAQGTLTLTGTLQANGQVTWVCGAPASGGIPAKYRPASCQGT